MRVRLVLGLLGLAAETIEIDHAGGALERSEFRALNPFGEVPVLSTARRALTNCEAILVYLARRYGAHWLHRSAPRTSPPACSNG
ncbi:MAG: glutathione S-transferase N-terminal domain-containing protein [Alphaproteobacteria bacterium]